MAKKKVATAHDAAANGAAAPAVVSIPAEFRVVRWFIWACTVGLGIGMLALMSQQLTGIAATYESTNPANQQYVGRSIRISYCMFSDSTDSSRETRCNFAYATAAVSLVLAFIWSYIQTMRRNVFKHPKAKLADLVLCSAWSLFWLAAGIILCVWTDRANKAGSFLSPAKAARNGFCVMAWTQFLLVALLTGTAALLYTSTCQLVFDSWEQKKQQRRVAQELAKQTKVAECEAAAAAAAKNLAAASPVPRNAAAAVGSVSDTAGHRPVAATGRVVDEAEKGRVGGPVSSNAAAGGAGARSNANAGADNPFK